MARTLQEFPETERASKYPWDTWFDGQIWELEFGTDFSTRIETFRQTCAKAAQKKGLTVRTAARKSGDKPVIVLQAQQVAPVVKRGRRAASKS